MTHHKKFKNESQDARRHDKHNVTHPEEQFGNHQDKSDKNHIRNQESKSDKRK